MRARFNYSEGVVFPYQAALVQLLTVNGDGTGSSDQANAITDYYIQPNADDAYVITDLVIFYEISGALGEGYGTSGTELTNGIQIIAQLRGGIEIDLTPGPLVIERNTGWNLIGTTTLGVSGQGGSTVSTIVVRGLGVYGNGAFKLRSNERLIFRVRDDLTPFGVTVQVAEAQGFRFPNPVVDPSGLEPFDLLIDDDGLPLIDDDDLNFLISQAAGL